MKMDHRRAISLLLLLIAGFCEADDHEADNAVSPTKAIEEDDTSVILRANNQILDFMSEGDVVIPYTRTARKCLNKKFSCMWPKSRQGIVEIPFTLSDRYAASDKVDIVNVMKGFHNSTCIRFIPRTTEYAYLKIEPRFGCYSLVGRTGDMQVLSLERPGCIKRSIIEHELLHALGFYHEHSRSDRDKYIRINWENINESYRSNFKKKDTNNLFTPYDYGSVLHYGRKAFGMYLTETITPIPDESVPIGEAKSMSHIDILRVNRLYKCWNYIG